MYGQYVDINTLIFNQISCKKNQFSIYNEVKTEINNLASIQLCTPPSFVFGSGLTMDKIWLWLIFGFSSALALVQLWLWFSFGFGIALDFDQLWLKISFVFGSALASAQLWLRLRTDFCWVLADNLD